MASVDLAKVGKNLLKSDESEEVSYIDGRLLRVTAVDFIYRFG